MKQTRFADAQIIGILKPQEAGVTLAAICREHAISEGTLYRWKSKCGAQAFRSAFRSSGMEVHEATHLRQLEQENARLKKLLAESMLDNAALKDVLSKKRDAGTFRFGARGAQRGRGLHPRTTQDV